MRKNVIHGRKPFITPKQKTGENDLHELLGNDCGYNEGTICVVNGRICVKRMVFRAWAHERVPLNSQWLVLKIGGTNFLHCWVADSIWLERAECLFRALTRFTAVLPVNNSLVHCIGLLLLGPTTHYRES